MDIQERIDEQSSNLVSQNKVQNILRDPKKYRKMMLILQQTLYDLGYHQSAKMLQQQSGISFYSKQLQTLKYQLDRNNFTQAIKTIDELIKQTQSNKKIFIKKKTLKTAQDMIYQTYCLQKIHQHNFDDAMNIMNQFIHNQEKKEKICQALVFDNFSLIQKDLQKKKNDIFKFCLSEYQQIGERQIQKVIECYTQYKGEQNKELKNLKFPLNKFPPMKILSRQASDIIKAPVTHLKINSVHDFLIAITESKEAQSLLLFKIHRKNLQYRKQISDSGSLSLKQKYPIFMFIKQKSLNLSFKNKKQSVQSLSISYSKQCPIIAICSFSILQLYNKSLQVLTRIESSTKIQKTLFLTFNPMNDLLYTCGYYQYLSIYDQSGIHITSIHPFPKTRKFIFVNNNKSIISISLVGNKLYKYGIEQQMLMKEKELDDGVLPMDICKGKGRNQNKIGVSSMVYMYVIDGNSLQVLAKAMAPSNPNKLNVEICFYGEYLISLCKNFHAYQLVQQNNNLINLNKIKQWPGEGTFAVSEDLGLFINGAKQLTVLQQGDSQMQIQQQSSFQSDQSLIDIENEDIQSEQDENDDISDQSDLNNMSEQEDSDSDEQIIQ